MRALMATVVYGSTLPIARSRTGTVRATTCATLTGTGGATALGAAARDPGAKRKTTAAAPARISRPATSSSARRGADIVRGPSSIAVDPLAPRDTAQALEFMPIYAKRPRADTFRNICPTDIPAGGLRYISQTRRPPSASLSGAGAAGLQSLRARPRV